MMQLLSQITAILWTLQYSVEWDVKHYYSPTRHIRLFRKRFYGSYDPTNSGRMCSWQNIIQNSKSYIMVFRNGLQI